jgi:hypothetical protein
MLTERLVYYERLTEFDAFILKEENPRLTEFVSDLHGAWESRANNDGLGAQILEERVERVA